jgi:hypothetical protein
VSVPIPKEQADTLAAGGRAVTDEQKEQALARLFVAWKAAPALRLGQLLVWVCEQEPPIPLDAVEDEALLAMVEAFAAERW